MRYVIVAGLRARKTRLLLTAAAIALGVAFVTGTLTLTDTMSAQLFDQTAAQAEPVDARATMPEGGLTDADLSRVRQLPGVLDAAGEAIGDAAVLGPDGKLVTVLGLTSAHLFTLPDSASLAGLRLADGRYPSRGEILLDQNTADERGWAVGTTLTLVGPAETRLPVRLVGVIAQDQPLTVRLPADDFRAVTGESGWSAIRVAGPPGADEGTLRDTVAAALPRAEVITGDAYTDRLASDAVGDVQMIRAGLLGFALVALAVAAMVIHNTFAILVAQRRQELALLRCAGAGRGQLFRLVLIEAAIVGAIAAAAGLALGIGIGTLGVQGLESLGNTRIAVPLQIGVKAVLAAAVVGVGVTVLAALAPALGATRLPPIAALRAPTSHGEVGAGRARVIGGVLAALVGAIGVAMGAVQATVLLAAVGALPVAVAVIALGPVLVVPVGRVVSRLPAALFGIGGRLAARSTQRQPRRSAATALALTVGITLITAFLVGADSLRVSIAQELHRQFPVDFAVMAPDGHQLPADLSADLTALPEVERVEWEEEGLLIWTADGVVASDARRALARVLDSVPLAVVTDVQTRAEEIGTIVDTMLAVVGVLIVLSVLIAVAGIANTLALSVLERTREFGLMRALGLSRGQLRASLFAEGLTLALIAAVTGVVLGLGFGVAGAYAAIPRDWVAISVPGLRIGLVVFGAAVVGLLAAVAPARTAARAAPVAALAAD